MKKIRPIIAILLIVQFSVAQTKMESQRDISERRHELKMETIKLMAVPGLELNYEYIKDVNQGFGAIVLLSLDKENYNEKLSLTPYFRFYFNTSQEYGAKGFFVKAFSSFYSGSDIEFFDEKEDADFFDIALGFGAGQKLINKSGFVFEYFIGVGRNLLGNSDETLLGKFGINVGYRF